MRGVWAAVADASRSNSLHRAAASLPLAFGAHAVASAAADDGPRALTPSESFGGFYVGSDGELSQALKKCGKKDPTTQARGLEDLRRLVASRDGATLRSALGHWLHLYRRMCFHGNRRVRALAQSTLADFAAAVPKAVIKRCRPACAVWWMAMHDTERAVSSTAASACAAAFSGDQQRAQRTVRHTRALASPVPA